MTRSNPSTWAKRLAAVFGASVMAFALVATPSAAQSATYPQPDLSKKPRLEHLMNQDFGTKGVKVKVRVLDYNHSDPNSTIYGEARVQLTVSGFSGPVTVWGRSYGNAENTDTRQPWQKIVATPKDGKVIITLPVAKISHCSKLMFRVNDSSGRWTKAFSVLTARETSEPHDSNGGTIYW